MGMILVSVTMSIGSVGLGDGADPDSDGVVLVAEPTSEPTSTSLGASEAAAPMVALPMVALSVVALSVLQS